MLTVHLLHLQQIPILQQLQIEEALLRADRRNWCLLNSEAPPAIVLGISGQREELVYEEKAAANKIPMVRRFSGGGTVVVEKSTCFATFIFNNEECAFAPFPAHIMEWTDQFYQPIFPFKLHQNDYVIGERKCGGNAQYITKDRWLHHSTFLWDYSTELMDCLRVPKRIPEYRKHRPHSDFLCTLKEFLPRQEEFHEKVVSHLSSKYIVKHVSLEEIKDILELPHRKSTVLL